MESVGNVLIIVENLPVPFDRRVWLEANTLKEAGYKVRVICPMGIGFEAEYEIINDIEIYRHPLPDEISSAYGYLREYFTALKWEYKLAKKIWRKDKFDIIHLCNPPDLLVLVTLKYKWINKVKVVYDQHDINPEFYIAKYDRKDVFYYLLLFFEFLTYRNADIVISTNESYKAIALRRGKKRSDEVYIVRSGPDLSKFKETEPETSYRKGKKYLVGYVGVMGEPEGIDILLQSISYIVNNLNNKDIHFILVGSGPILEEMKKLASRLAINDYLDFPGRVSDNELLSILSSCDVCVNPDRNTQFNNLSTMNKVLEYMALGKPLVQFNLLEGKRSAGNASLYAEPDNVEDFAEKILFLLNDKELAKQMGIEGLNRMTQKLSWSHQEKELLKAYKAING